jgi:alpha-galactosidase
MENIGFGQADLYPYSGPGHWNDPDMLVVGQVGWGEGLHKTRLSPNEQYTHISLWALLSAPLLIGCDLTQIDNFTLNLLTNSEVIDINQDAAGKQARRILKNDDLEIWLKELSDGSLAIGLFNRGWLDADLTLSSDDLPLDCENYMIRDVWRQQNLGKFNTRFATRLPKHGCQLIKLTKP